MNSTTPPIRLSGREFLGLLKGFALLLWPMIAAIFGNSPWKMLGTADERREYWRKVALILIRTGGYNFSIKHLQYLLPSTKRMVASWGPSHGYAVDKEQIEIYRQPNGSTGVENQEHDDPIPWVHWIGGKPPPNRNNMSNKCKVLLYIHGGGFVLPLSAGPLVMMTTLMKEAKGSTQTPIYLAIAEYTIAPYCQYPTQIRQCLAIVSHLHLKYGLDLSDMVLVGDSCGGSIIASILSHLIHPTSPLPIINSTSASSSSAAVPMSTSIGTSFPSTLRRSKLTGVLLISPWTSLATTAPSYAENADLDTLPADIIRRFRDTYIVRSALLPTAQADPARVVVARGYEYFATNDPLIVGLEQGVGAVRPLGSYTRENAGEITNSTITGGASADAGNATKDEWWSPLDQVVSRMMITAGEQEGFRDDILTFSNQIIANRPSGSTLDVEVVVDDSFHAVLISDFAFGAPPGTLAAKLSGWLVDTLRDDVTAE